MKIKYETCGVRSLTQCHFKPEIMVHSIACKECKHYWGENKERAEIECTNGEKTK